MGAKPTSRDMRTKQHKQHLGTAQKRDEYEQRGNVVVQESKVNPGTQEQQAQKGEGKRNG